MDLAYNGHLDVADVNGDGIGDIPITICGSGNQDLYPLGYFDGEPPSLDIIKPKPNTLYFMNDEKLLFLQFLLLVK
jgi:hypothetical protein